jgi:hypothetical protein
VNGEPVRLVLSTTPDYGITLQIQQWPSGPVLNVTSRSNRDMGADMGVTVGVEIHGG